MLPFAGVTPECTVADENMLATLGMHSSRLSAPDTIAALIGGSIEVAKPKLRALSGLFSNGDGYPDYAHCVWAIELAGATRIILTFNRFNVETDYDYVYVYDGLTEDDPLLATLTGENVPQSVTSTRGAMLVVLKSDGGFATQGFEAVYRAEDAPVGVVPPMEEDARVCREPTYRDHVPFACRLCVLATVSHVCGESCIEDRMHIVDTTSPKISKLRPAPCLPSLALRLATEQTKRLEDALQWSEPFGLSQSSPERSKGNQLRVADLYLPMLQERLFGNPVYVGMDTGHYVVSCDPNKYPHLWVITASLDRTQAAECVGGDGAVWVDLATGAARDRLELTPSIPVPLMVHTGLGGCNEALSSTPVMSADILTPRDVMAAACWLARFFGPQSDFAVANVARVVPSVIKLALPGQPKLALVSDLVLRGTQRLSIIGGDAVVVGAHQFRVSPNAELTLDSVTIADSSSSSALLVEGRVFATKTTFRNCFARWNVLGPSGVDSNGGVAHVAQAGQLSLNAALVTDNGVQDGASNFGGAIYAIRSKVTVIDSTLQRNSAHMAEDNCNGGAIALVDGTECELNSTRLAQNSVKGGKFAAGGAVYAAGSSVRIFSGSMNENIVYQGAISSSGGGLMLTGRSIADLAEIEVAQNVAQDSLAVYGGGLCVFKGSSIKVQRGTIRGNVAERSSDRAYGGGLFFRESSGELRDSVVLDNAARDVDGYAIGGGLFARDRTTLTISTTTFRGNTVSNATR